MNRLRPLRWHTANLKSGGADPHENATYRRENEHKVPCAHNVLGTM